MGDPMSGIRSFWRELRRRRVLRVATVYAAAGWAIVEVSATVLPLLQVPDWAGTLVLVLILLGFPLALALAWAFDITPAGVRRETRLVDPEPGPRLVRDEVPTPPQVEAAAEPLEPRRQGLRSVGPSGAMRQASPAPAPSPELASPEEVAPAPATAHRRGRWYLLAVGAALVLGGAALGYRALQAGSALSGGERRVMVLPFENRTGDPSLDPVGQMVAEWISGGLVETPEVDVVPHAMLLEALASSQDGALERAGSASPLARLAELTGAGLAVTGSYYRQGDSLEFHAEVMDVGSRKPLATVERVRTPGDDPGQGIALLRTQVMGALAARLSPYVAWELPPAAQPPNYQAYQAYLNGIDEWAVGDYAASARWYQEAYARDTTYLRALGFAWAAWGNAGDQARRDSLEQILLARREELPRYDRYRLDWSRARRQGDHQRALAVARAAQELNPTGTLRLGLALSLRETNHPREAREAFEDWFARVGSSTTRWFGLWTQYAVTVHILGDYDRELEVARWAREELQGGELDLMAAEGRALAGRGEAEAVWPLAVEIESFPGSGTEPGAVLANLAAELRAHGTHDASVRLLERARAWEAAQPRALRTSVAGRLLLGRLLYLSERWEEAAEVWAAMDRDSLPLATRVRAAERLGAAAARQGDTDRARHQARRLEELSDPALNGRATLGRARIAALLGDRAEAVELLRRALSEGVAYGLWLHRDMDLEALRDAAAYRELVRPKH